MNENIDLTKILKDCPKGTMFYSTIYGYVYFDKIEKDSSYPIIFETSQGDKIDTTANGRNCKYFDGECVLLPSKDQRDWSKFTAPWLEKQDDSLRVNDRAWLYLVSDVLTWKNGIGQYLDDPRVQALAKRLCSEYAQKLYNPSVLSNSSNTGKNEQKYADKVESKFKVGDWIISSVLGAARIIGVNDSNEYQLEYVDGKQKFSSIDYVNYAYNKWTIQDAKDGDVLVHSSFMFDDFIFIYNNTSILQAYCYYSNERNKFIIEDRGHHCPWNMQEVTPATKEQRDALMKAMNDAGYEWDTEKKELKKLVEVPDRFNPKTLQPFDKILVKGNKMDCVWKCSLHSHFDADYRYSFCANTGIYKKCIPYNDETKHLVGTTEEAPEYYRYWED